MQQFAQWERQQMAAIKKPTEEAVKCTSCGCTWFETINIFQYKADHNVILGQEVPKLKGDVAPYKMLRCVKCNLLLEPRVMRNMTVAHDYDQLLDTLEAPQAQAPQAEKTAEELLQARIAELEARIESLSRERDTKGKKSKKNEETEDAVQDKG